MFKFPEITYPLTVDTIGKQLALGYDLTVYCDQMGCGHHARVNLVALADKLGMDHPSMARDLAPHFYCSKCRVAGRLDKCVSFKVSPCTDPHSAWPRDRP